jgi:hypothetical protein
MLNDLSSGPIERQARDIVEWPFEHLHGRCNPASVGLDTWLCLYVGVRRSV